MANIVQQTQVYGFADTVTCPAFGSAVTAGHAIALVAYGYPISLAISSSPTVGDGTANVYNLVLFYTTSTNTFPITFTAPPTGTSGTLTTGFGGVTTFSETIFFSDGEIRTAHVINGSTAVTWTTAISGSPTVNATAYANAPGMMMWLCQNSVGGTLTPVVSANAAGGYSALYGAEIANVGTSGILLGSSANEQFSPGTGTNALTSNAVSVSQSAVLFGFCFDASVVATNNPASGGTGFAAQAGVWNTGTYLTAMAEDLIITSSASATYTSAAPGGDTFFTLAMALAQPINSPLLLGQICL